jgi:hypothetical protein
MHEIGLGQTHRRNDAAGSPDISAGRTVHEVCDLLNSKNVVVALVTTSVGQFIGALRRDELCHGMSESEIQTIEQVTRDVKIVRKQNHPEKYENDAANQSNS